KETIANLLTWAFLLLGLHQEWQTKAREEVDRVVGQNVFPCADNLANLMILKNVKLMGGLAIPTGTRLVLVMTAVHHDVRIWGEDANVFNPMRFLEPRDHLASFFPFGLGPRVCVGQNLAVVEAKVVLAMIISRYSFVVSPSYVHAPMQSLALQPQLDQHHYSQLPFKVPILIQDHIMLIVSHTQLTMSFVFLISLLFTFFTILYKYIWIPLRIQRHFRLQGIQGPSYRPIFGNSAGTQRRMIAEAQSSRSFSFNHEGVVQRVMPQFYNWSKVYGDTFLYWFGPKARLAISDPDMIKEILVSKSGSFGKIKFDPATKLLFGDGLVALEGERWVVHRRIASQAFNMERVKEWVPEIVDSTQNMMNNWDANIEASNKSEFEFDVHKEFHQLSGEIISRTAFGSNYIEGKRIFELQEQQTVLVLQSFRNVYIPGFRFIPTKHNRTLWRLEKETTELITKLIKKNKSTKQNSNTLLYALISPSNKDDILDLKEIVDECKTFYVAGKQTIANLLTWAFLLLGLHQEWQNKAQEEVDRVCGQNVFPCAGNLQDLKIVTLILNETLRLYPPAGMMMRDASENVKLAGGLNVPAGTRLFLAMTAVHHDPRNHLASFFPFGLGHTICVGQNLAVVEAKIVLAMILSRYSFVISPSYVHAPMQSLAVQPQFGAQIVKDRL
ncbi:hypothetical protein M8C21_011774, partial [Ambrosia artemisiifolia]